MAALAQPSPAGRAEYPCDEVWNALRDVEDPEMGISIVDLGLVISALRDGPHADVQITYTAMGCPATEMIESDIVARLKRLPGITNVAVAVVWDPVWTKARLTADACDALQLVGIAI